MTTAAWLSSVGLVFDIVGVLLLFKYGLPSEWRDTPLRALEETAEEERERAQHNRNIQIGARTGLCLIILGFMLQLLGTIISGQL